MAWAKKGNPGCGCCDGGDCPVNVCGATMPDLCEITVTVYGHVINWAFDPGDIVWEPIPTPPDEDHHYCRASVPNDPSIDIDNQWHIEEEEITEQDFYQELACTDQVAGHAGTYDFVLDFVFTSRLEIKLTAQDVELTIRKNIATNQVSYKVDLYVSIFLKTYMLTNGTMVLDFAAASPGTCTCSQTWTLNDASDSIGSSCVAGGFATCEAGDAVLLSSGWVDLTDCSEIVDPFDTDSVSVTSATYSINLDPIADAECDPTIAETAGIWEANTGCVFCGIGSGVLIGWEQNSIVNYYMIEDGTLTATIQLSACP